MTQKQILKESVELIEKMINGSAWYLIPQHDKSKGKKLIDAYNKIKCKRNNN